MKTNVMRILGKMGVGYVVKAHSRPVYTSEDAAQERGVRLSQIAKTMLVKLADGKCIVALIPGDRKLDLKGLGKLAGSNKMQFLPREEVRKFTGYEPGAVSPVGMVRNYTIFFDKALLQEEFIDISSGLPNAGVELRSADLLRILKATVAEVSE